MTAERLTIDLNCDMGELPELLANGTEEALMQQVSSANIACGGHAGSPESMRGIVNLAKKYGVEVGAHVSYPDRANFGRKEIALSADEIEDVTYSQISLLAKAARDSGLVIRHLKPHGALYHTAQRDRMIATAIAKAAGRFDRELRLVEQALSPVLSWWSAMGFEVLAEAFADRIYESARELRSRSAPEALIANPSLAAQQALRIVQDHSVLAPGGSQFSVEARTICVHSDSPGALETARWVRAAFLQAGIEIKAPGT